MFATNITFNRSSISLLSIDQSVTLTTNYSYGKNTNKVSKIRNKSRPTSAQIYKSSQFSPSKVKNSNFCAFWEQIFNRENAFEYPVISVIKVIEFYLKNSTFNNINPKNSVSDNMKLSEEINQICIPVKLEWLANSNPTKSKRKRVPKSYLVLYPEMHYKTYVQKVNDPKFIYENVKLCSEWYSFVKHIQTWIDISLLSKPNKISTNTDLSNLKQSYGKNQFCFIKLDRLNYLIDNQIKGQN